MSTAERLAGLRCLLVDIERAVKACPATEQATLEHLREARIRLVAAIARVEGGGLH